MLTGSIKVPSEYLFMVPQGDKMNIPDDPFFAMLARSLQARAGETT
jgi:hypothetical protein